MSYDTTDYHGITVWAPDSTGSGGLLVQNAFKELADRIGPSHSHAGPPDADDDEVDTGGNGACFVNSLWHDTTADKWYVCTDSSEGAAVWSCLQECDGPIDATKYQLAGNDFIRSLGTGDVQIGQDVHGDGNYNPGTSGTNVYLGYMSGYEAGGAQSQNVCIGALSGVGLNGQGMVCIGYQAGYCDIDVNQISDCTYIGHDAGRHTNDCTDSVCVGAYAGKGAATGFVCDRNVIIGAWAGPVGTTFVDCVIIGEAAGYELTEGYSNVFIGASAGHDTTDGYGNVAIGKDAGESLTGGYANVILGLDAGDSLTTGYGNVIIGPYAASGQLTTECQRLWIQNTSAGTPLIGGDFDAREVTIDGSFHLLERSSDPAEPAEGEAVIWMSDGTGKGDDGDVLIASKAGGATKWSTLFDHSAGAAW
jgi:hypothetical protein